MAISDELIRQFMSFGLSKQQATSTTTEKLVEYFMPDEGKSLILEAKRQVSAMEDMVNIRRAEDVALACHSIHSASVQFLEFELRRSLPKSVRH